MEYETAPAEVPPVRAVPSTPGALIYDGSQNRVRSKLREQTIARSRTRRNEDLKRWRRNWRMKGEKENPNAKSKATCFFSFVSLG
ncbi:hypothetical protein D0Y65_050303 [Glycine soja]|uniref:Uncharacterized protein n=1 Tax=Glycine soja TaxID=3848 RepID=A0A445FBM3_GLYSO|nr:hypothetical protein D0Y65_050303 [Glycine soja]